MEWIHRDIKPDNFLISASGHLKISDFGLAFNGHWAHCQSYYANHRYSLLDQFGIKVLGDSQDVVDDREMVSEPLYYAPPSTAPDPAGQGSQLEALIDWRNRNERRNMARSVVGTSQYMAPEVIKGEAYDGRCDWWSIGIILYECLYGRTPFYCDNRQQTKERICRHRSFLHFPTSDRVSRPTSERPMALGRVSPRAIDLLCALLTDKNARLSSQDYRDAHLPRCGLSRQSPVQRHVFPNSARDIKSHDFFRNVRWSRLHLTRPPFVPRVKENQSIAKYFEDEKHIVSYTSSNFRSIRPDDELELGGEDDAVPLSVARNVPDVTNPETLHKTLLGLEHHADGELERVKEYLGPAFPAWRLRRMFDVREGRRQRVGKRPRDKILRDPETSKAVMELRKKGAFFGYTYRRPHLMLGNSGSRGRGYYSRPTILPVSADEPTETADR